MALVLAPSNLTATSKQLAFDNDDACSMNVFFRFVDGKTFCLWLDPAVSIASMKQAVVDHQRTTGHAPSLLVAAKDIFFVWNGKPLTDRALLQDYIGVPAVGHKSSSSSSSSNCRTVTIFVTHRQRGGCFMVSFSIIVTICTAFLTSPCTCGFGLLIIPVLLPLLFVLPLFCL